MGPMRFSDGFMAWVSGGGRRNRIPNASENAEHSAVSASIPPNLVHTGSWSPKRAVMLALKLVLA